MRQIAQRVQVKEISATFGRREHRGGFRSKPNVLASVPRACGLLLAMARVEYGLRRLAGNALGQREIVNVELAGQPPSQHD